MTICNFKQASLITTWFNKQSFRKTNELSNDKADPKTMKCVWLLKETTDQ
jgi:hypothetical protein